MNFLRRRSLALFIGLWTGFTGAKAQFVINELMQSNVDVLMDDTNQFPDSWVEIYNPMATARDLRDYRINNTRDFQSAHKLAACSVPSKGYALIYCDNDHTGFRLDSDAGGGIYLYNPMGQLVNCVVDIGRQPAPNTAFGRTEDGGSEWAYLTQPTPAASNSTASPALGLLPVPEFSRKGFV
ncbi:MAG: hypothetical protein HUK02_08865 [Bacteroidaceae bacterium]|nr:hypothetical protein [Bacteroidaceae bacterium]